MPRRYVHLTVTFLLLLRLLFLSSIASTPRSSRPPMFLPLFHYPLDSPKTFLNPPRRCLQRSYTNAHMRLYDDLLRNGYYTTRLWIGTPPQRFALIVDTGSTVTYVPCSNCEQCGRHEDPRFQPELSSTYQSVKCNIDCTCDDDRMNCVYERQYAEMSTSSGVLGEDIVSFGNQSELEPQRVVFGCENVETGDLYSQHADGIMGLGRGDTSIVDQLVEKGAINDSFSLCYGGMEIGGGAMVLGAIPNPPDMVFTDSDPDRSPYYNIDLKEVRVAGKPLSLNPNVFDGKHGTVLDSGTTYAYFPEEAFTAFKDAIMKELHTLKQIRGPDPNYNDICFSGAGSDISQISKTFPEVDMVFGNGQKLALSPENYLFQHSKVRGAYCVGIFQNGRDPTTLLGGIVVRNTLVVYDRENSKVGFWKTNCSELWERLHIAVAPPPSPASPDVNTSAVEMPPSLPPSAQSHYVLPGENQIGKITFEMLLNLNYSDLKPHITELIESIAQELGINSSQVHFLNVAAKGNDSLIEWVVLPSGLVAYISNVTATRIIGKVAEHGILLPDKFGSYQLILWKTEILTNRTWWQQHYLLMVLAIVVTLILVLTSGIFIWRHRQQPLNAYKPVNGVVPEQELQPL